MSGVLGFWSLGAEKIRLLKLRNEGVVFVH